MTYHDALVNKRNRVVVAVVETFGGHSPQLAAAIRYLGRRARRAGGRDRTAYGKSRASPRDFRVHHEQRISVAVIRANALNILDQVACKKRAAADAAKGAAAVGGG